MGFVAYAWALAVLAVVLVGAAIADLRTAKVHNWITYPAIAAGLIGHTLAGGLTGHDGAMGLAGSLAGLAVGFLPTLAVWLAGGIGGGDVKLMAAVGALAGWRFAIMAMFYGLIVAALMAIGVMIKQRIVRRTLRRIFRFLYLVFTPTKPGNPATAESPTVPFGFALCIGSALAIAEVIIFGPGAKKLLLGI